MKKEEMKYDCLKDYVNHKVKEIIDNYLDSGKGWVFVLVGLSDIINMDGLRSYIDDPDTFLKNGNNTVFDKKWFNKKIFSQIIDEERDCHVFSYPQYTYLTSYLNDAYFGEKVVYIRDNLRRLYLMDQAEYVVKGSAEEEERPDSLPLYQAEQICLDEGYYYTLVAPSEGSWTLDVFDEKSQLNYFQNDDNEIPPLDINSDKYALDIFINDCFRQGDLSRKVVIKYLQKQPNNPIDNQVLQKLNYLLGLFGGRVTIKPEDAIKAAYIREDTVSLLKEYWGNNADFRNLVVYGNPNVNKETIEISQGMLVETIIDEYKNAKKGIEPRDLFLTAPTGAGKSLLFQLPAFYISRCGDVTIIVSPLIALMKDQVKAIVSDRHFEKVAYINSELNVLERDTVTNNIKAGLIDIVYLSPELLLSYDLSFFIGERNLGLLVVDEAHLITTWGRDFRVDYWHLGNYIRKSRKYRDGKFPMVAVTATAVYGGVNDMVFDGIDSLYMQNPHIFIGQVKRNDIEFVINNYELVKKGYNRFKIQQTIAFIKEAVDNRIKTIVYVPYIKHIDAIINAMPTQLKDYVGAYYGSLDSDLKEYAYKMFKTGEKNVMLCTKAFGMGVDISDIQVVYHHAPSGLLPDYVQEIGRVARKEGLQGYAMLDYSPQDQNYSKILHGMSSIRLWQLREVLKKIHSLYIQHGKKRNMLVSVDDFAFIFEGAADLDQKVLTSLMMLEKDYLAKHRFNVLIARPRKLFSIAYAKVTNEEQKLLKEKYSNVISIVQRTKNGKAVIELDLAKLWEKHFSKTSFPLLKRSFYNGKLFEEEGVSFTPQVKVSYNLSMSSDMAYSKLSDFFAILKSVFSTLSYNYFTLEEFTAKLTEALNDEKKAKKLARFILSTYSETNSQGNSSTFLQLRKIWGREDYCIYNTRYIESFAYLLQRFDRLFDDSENNTVNTFVTNNDLTMIGYTRLGYFLELLDLGTYEMKGGENPVVFIRLNDPDRIERDALNPGYKNHLLQKTLQKFEVSNLIFDYFFCRQFSNEERWNFIEDFFLGSDNDDLEKKYVGENISNRMDLLKQLRSITPVVSEESCETPDEEGLNFFPPNPNIWYEQSSMLTIETPKGKITRRISEWLMKDPIMLDKVRTKYNLKFSNEVFNIIVSKIRQNKDYFTEARGLKVRIEFKGYTGLVQAIVPYKDKPVEFYKWWCKNEEKVHLTYAEKVQLFLKVIAQEPNALLKKHEKLIS